MVYLQYRPDLPYPVIVRELPAYTRSHALFDGRGVAAFCEAGPFVMTIDGIEASFALLRADDTVTISARSHDKINVQIIMQRLGGGGHFDMAGARLTHTSLEAACVQLKTVLDEYMDHEYESERATR